MGDPSPFQPGVRVAVGRDAKGYREAFVGKVYKNGNFTLRGDTQQWRPSQAGYQGSWSAQQTGQVSWQAPSLLLWDAETDPRIAARNAEVNRRGRLYRIVNAIRNLKPEGTSEEVVAGLEALVSRARSEVQDQTPSRS